MRVICEGTGCCPFDTLSYGQAAMCYGRTQKVLPNLKKQRSSAESGLF